ncbi:MAG TPA: hypothetical protein VMF58_04480 [Rhizomicrobium sp.]|nr:hypothetical protein [Rhizomicrobium sp.]
MTQESAAGPKTDHDSSRAERLAASLEEQFHTCRRETDVWLSRCHSDEGYLYPHKLDGLLKLFHMNAQLASVITRIDAAQNRKTKTQ